MTATFLLLACTFVGCNGDRQDPVEWGLTSSADSSGDTATRIDPKPDTGSARSDTRRTRRDGTSTDTDVPADTAADASRDECEAADESSHHPGADHQCAGGIDQGREWVHILGTTKLELINDAAVDGSGNIYVVGSTLGSLGGRPNSGNFDAFLARFDASGDRKWVRLVGSSLSERAKGVSVDQSGNVYVVGRTEGELGGRANSGRADAFVVKYTASGNRQWIRLLGSTGSESAAAVAANDSGSVYVAGGTWGALGGRAITGRKDGFVARYDASGNRHWVRLLGSSKQDVIRSMSAGSSGNVYVAGTTRGDLVGHALSGTGDGFIARYEVSGERSWVRLLGSSSWDEALGVFAGGPANVYVVGQAGGRIGGQTYHGAGDGMAARYNACGSRSWLRLFGLSNWERIKGVSADRCGNVYVAGVTRSDLGDQKTGGDTDGFVARYGAAGKRQSVRLFGSPSQDGIVSVAVGGSGNVYIVGETHGDLGGATARGEGDGFVARLN